MSWGEEEDTCISYEERRRIHVCHMGTDLLHDADSTFFCKRAPNGVRTQKLGETCYRYF